MIARTLLAFYNRLVLKRRLGDSYRLCVPSRNRRVVDPSSTSIFQSDITKEAIVTIANGTYTAPLLAFLFSLRRNGNIGGRPVVILTDGSIPSGIYSMAQKMIPGIEFRIVDPFLYRDIPCAERTRIIYYSFECFNMMEFDRVIFIDSDTLILDDISELFRLEGPFLAVTEINRFGQVKKIEKTGKLMFNAGVMVIGRENINSRVYEMLLSAAHEGLISGDRGDQGFDRMTDQRILNLLIAELGFQSLDTRYNIKSAFVTHFFGFRFSDAVILHIHHGKPWNIGYSSGFPAVKSVMYRYRRIWELWLWFFNEALRFTGTTISKDNSNLFPELELVDAQPYHWEGLIWEPF